MDVESLLNKITNYNLSSREEEDQRKKLSAAINELLVNDFSKLIQLLYRIDVSETKLKETLRNNPAVDAGELIADLLVQRQAEKMALRKNYDSSTGESNEERW